MKIYIFAFSLFVSINSYSQDASENTGNKSHEPVPLNVEKIAWEMMYPSTHKKTERPPHIILYEEVLLKMKAGTAALAMLMGEFELRTQTNSRNFRITVTK